MNGEDRKTKEKVLAKLFLLDEVLQIAIGRSYDTRIDADCVQTADAFKTLFFDNAQNLRLNREVKLADFVQEDRPLIGKFEFTDLAREGAGI